MNDSRSDDKAYAFKEVFREELKEVLKSRRSRLDKPSDPDYLEKDLDDFNKDPFAAANDLQLMGLAFSGGGIRSATFNLGILQALAKLKLLRYFDYLSTVSGGGYIGSWLSMWMTRESGNENQPGERGIRKIEEILAASADEEPHHEEPPQITFLRRYSNYLTPRNRFFSGDTWTSISTYIRNSFLILLLLLFTLSAGLLFPRWIPALSSWLSETTKRSYSIAIAGGVLLALAMAYISANLAVISAGVRRGKFYPRYATLPYVQFSIILPTLLAAWLTSLWLGLSNLAAGDGNSAWRGLLWMLAVGVLYIALCAIGWLFGQWRQKTGQAFKLSRRDFDQLIWAFPAGAVGGLLAYGMAQWMGNWTLRSGANHVLIVTWGPPLMVLLALVIVTLHVGFIGHLLKSEMHEWWLRLGGWLLIYTFASIMLFVVALYGPLLIYHLESAWARSGLTLTWVLTTIAGVLAGKSPITGPKDCNSWMNLVAKIGPYVFVLGFVVLIALGLDVFFRGGWPEPPPNTVQYWQAIGDSGQQAFSAFLFCVGLALLLAWRFDINLFSLHYYYRNRLVRCYLGASRAAASDGQNERQPQPFTGFDPDDDCKLATLRTDLGPYPIINTALNLVAGDELAWQQRKAASFVFTPKFCGYDVWSRGGGNSSLRPGVGNVELEPEAYRKTEYYADGFDPSRPRGPRPNAGGLTVGTAMAVSGAAFSPNMGYHSSPAVTFLLTVFSVRLGLWLGNPRHKKGWRQPGPMFALWPLMAELFGLTNERRRFCNLSDGGHFENLGIYELVRRRCRFIIAIDAGQDDKFSFEDLGNAIRKCRVDLHTEILLRAAALCPDKDTKRSLRHCVVGTIRYPDATIGTLVYIKPTLTGNETADILNYANEHAEFPHQSTKDQWFDESQFESYRKLGYHTGCAVFSTALQRVKDSQAEGLLDKASFFVALRQLWYPSSPSTGRAFTKHTEMLHSLFERLSQSKELQFLDPQIYPEWESLTKAAEDRPQEVSPVQFGLPKDYAALREGFYFCNSLIQLMESVYLDLNLEEEWSHPDNRGWMNLFKHWSWADMMRATWAISIYTYGARFQSFGQQHLGLRTGQIEIEPFELGGIHRQSLVEDVGRRLSKAEEEKKLNFVEVQIITRIVAANQGQITQPDRLKVFLLRMSVPASSGRTQLLKFTFGFALVYGNNLGYFRIQDHLRKTGLGSRALVALLQDSRTSHISTAEPFAIPLTLSEISKENIKRFKELFRAYRLEPFLGNLE